MAYTQAYGADVLTMSHDTYFKAEANLIPDAANNILGVISDTSLLGDVTSLDSLSSKIISDTGIAVSGFVGVVGTWKGVIDCQKLLPTTSWKKHICAATTLSGGVARIARTVTKVAESILKGVKAVKSVPFLSGLYTALSGVVYTLLLVPKVLDLIETMNVYKELKTPQPYATEEEDLRYKFERIKSEYVITNGDITAYRQANSSSKMNEATAIDALAKIKRKKVVERYGNKSLEMLEKLVPEQVQKLSSSVEKQEEDVDLDLTVGMSFEEVQDGTLVEVADDGVSLGEMKALVETATAALSKSIKIQFSLAAISAAVGISVVSITFATGGFSAAFFQTVLTLGSVVSALKDLYSLYASFQSDAFKKSDIISLSIALGIAFISMMIGSAEMGSVDTIASTVVGGWTLFAALSSMLIYHQAKKRRLKEEQEAKRLAELT